MMMLPESTAIVSCVSLVAATASAAAQPRLFVVAYAIVVAALTCGSFFENTLRLPYAWILVVVFVLNELVIVACKLRAMLEAEGDGKKRGSSAAAADHAWWREALRVPENVLVNEKLRATRKLMRMAPLVSGIYASLLGWCGVCIVWVGTFDSSSAASNVLVASLTIVACCAAFEVSVQMDSSTTLTHAHWMGGVVVQSLLVHPSVAVALVAVGTAVGVAVLPPSLAAAYAACVCAFPFLFVVAVRACRGTTASSDASSSYMWDVRMTTETAWWTTLLALERSGNAAVTAADARRDEAALAMASVSLAASLVAMGMMLHRTVPMLVREANDA